MIQVEHYQEDCIGCHYCVDLLPAYYKMDFSQGRAVLIGASGTPLHLLLPDTEKKDFDKVVRICPTEVIRVKKI